MVLEPQHPESGQCRQNERHDTGLVRESVIKVILPLLLVGSVIAAAGLSYRITRRVSVVVRYRPPYDSDIVYGKPLSHVVDGVILEVTDEGLLSWRIGIGATKANSRQLTNAEFNGLKSRIRKAADSLHESSDRPGFIADFPLTCIRITDGLSEAPVMFNMTPEAFFSREPLPGHRPSDRWQNDDVQELKRFLVELCR